MKINRNNYEAYFLDYIEGKLGKQDIAELMHFISAHPDLKEELESFENINLVPETNKFSEKSSLKKSSLSVLKINEENFDEYCIAKLEGDLGETEIIAFNTYIDSNPSRKDDFKLYEKLQLKADKSIMFSEKDNLKKLLESEIVNNKIFEEYCVAYFEGQLNENSKKKLEDFISNSDERKIEFEFFAKAHLKIDENVIFKHKGALKKTKVINLNLRTVLRITSAAAAIIVLFLIIKNSNILLKQPVENIAQSNTEQNYIQQKVQTNSQIAEQIAENTKKGDAKEKIKEKAKTKILTSPDTIMPKPGKLRNLSPIIINTGQNFLFSMEQNLPQITSGYIEIAEVSKPLFENQQIPEKNEPVDDYLTLDKFIVERFKKMVLQDEYAKDKNITYLDLANAGISGIDKLMPGKIDFEHKQNADGEIQYLALNTKHLGYSKTFKK